MGTTRNGISGSRGDQESTVYGRTRGRLLSIKGTDANHRQLHCRLLFGDEKVVQNLDARFVDWTGTETESVRYLCRSKEEQEIERDGQNTQRNTGNVRYLMTGNVLVS